MVKKKDILPDTVLIEKERALEALKYELKNAETRVRIQNNAKKYHMVRFFERKKALRRYTQALKLKNEDQIREAAIDLCYVVNFPKTEKYIALYPSDDNGAATKVEKKGLEKTDARRSQYHDLIAGYMKSNDLPVSLDDILKGKKLGREDTGVQLDDRTEDGKPEELSASEEEDDFFE